LVQIAPILRLEALFQASDLLAPGVTPQEIREAASLECRSVGDEDLGGRFVCGAPREDAFRKRNRGQTDFDAKNQPPMQNQHQSEEEEREAQWLVQSAAEEELIDAGVSQRLGDQEIETPRDGNSHEKQS